MFKSEMFFDQQSANRFMSKLSDRGILYDVYYYNSFFDELGEIPVSCIEVTYDD